jgi:DNA-binding XRE family transcriptional regulator
MPEIDAGALHHIRRQRGATHEMLAALTGLRETTIQLMERRDLVASMTTARLLAAAPGVEPEELFVLRGDDDEKRRVDRRTLWYRPALAGLRSRTPLGSRMEWDIEVVLADSADAALIPLPSVAARRYTLHLG